FRRSCGNSSSTGSPLTRFIGLSGSTFISHLRVAFLFSLCVRCVEGSRGATAAFIDGGRMSTENPASPVSNDPITPAGSDNPVSADGAKPDEPLGAPGLAALRSEREARAAAEKAAADALAKVKEFEDRDKSEAQKQQEALEKAQRELAELTVAKT